MDRNDFNGLWFNANIEAVSNAASRNGRDMESLYFLRNSVKGKIVLKMCCFPKQTCISGWECLFNTSNTSSSSFSVHNRPPVNLSEELISLKETKSRGLSSFSSCYLEMERAWYRTAPCLVAFQWLEACPLLAGASLQSPIPCRSRCHCNTASSGYISPAQNVGCPASLQCVMIIHHTCLSFSIWQLIYRVILSNK